jgi:tetratricopeptide (TPR) repeat protein
MNLRWILAASLIAGPAFASFRCPARGGNAWREYRSAHFLIDTDAGAKDAQSLVRELEHIRALLLQALVGEQVDIPGRLRVVAFSDQTDFTEMGGQVVGAYYTYGQLGEPSIVLPVRLLWKDPETLAHELAHHLSYFLFPVQPHWFSEGLAEWVQTVAALPAEKATTQLGSHIVRSTQVMSGAMAGSIPLNLVSWLGYDARPMPAKELLAWDGRETSTSGGRGHLWSWVLYHWLWNQRGKAFADYQKRLADSGDPEASWRGTFPEFDPGNPEALSKLDFELDRYRRNGRFGFYKVEAQGDAAFSEEAISSTDLHLLLLSLRRNWPEEADQQKAIRRAVVEEAVAEDPGNPVARFSQMQLVEKVDPEAMKTAVNARPADWRGWLILGEAGPKEEREAALRKAVELNPLSARAQNDLAWVLATSDRAREALPLANRALDLAPWNAAFVDTLAEVAARLGKCAEALQLEKRAVATAPGEGMRKRQAEIEQRCSAPR